MIDANAVIIDEAIRVLESFGVDYPGHGSDPDAIRAQAELYRGYAEAVRQSYGQVGSSLSGIDWAGSAADSHHQLVQYHIRLANDAAVHLDNTAAYMEVHAVKADTIIRTIAGIALEILEALLATIALSWAVGWMAQMIFLYRTHWLISRAAELCQAFRRLVASAVEVMRGVGSTAGKIAEYTGQVFTKWLPEYIADSATMYTGMMAPEFLSGRGLSNAKDVFLYVLLPFEALDFAGYFTLHLLHEETKIGMRVKNAVDNYGRRDESAARGADPIHSASRGDAENASVRSAAEANPSPGGRTEGIELTTMRDGVFLRSVAGSGEAVAGRGTAVGEGAAATEGSVGKKSAVAGKPVVGEEAVAVRESVAGEGVVAGEPGVASLVHRSTDLTLVAPEAGETAVAGAGHVVETKAVLDDTVVGSFVGGGEAAAVREPVAGDKEMVGDRAVTGTRAVAGDRAVAGEPGVESLVHRSTDDVSLRVSEAEEVAVGAAGYVAPTKAQVLYGVAQEFLVTAAANTILNLAHGNTDPGHLLWGLLGGGAFAAADKGVRNGYALPYVMRKKPEGVPDELWLWTVGQVLKAGLHSGRFVLKAPFTDLVLESDIDTQLGSLPTS